LLNNGGGGGAFAGGAPGAGHIPRFAVPPPHFFVRPNANALRAVRMGERRGQVTPPRGRGIVSGFLPLEFLRQQAAGGGGAAADDDESMIGDTEWEEFV